MMLQLIPPFSHTPAQKAAALSYSSCLIQHKKQLL